MSLKITSVVGEALHFGWRRFETSLRTSALPLALLFVFNMASVFAYLSVANGSFITFKDVAAAGATYGQAQALARMAAQEGLEAGSAPIWAIYVSTLIITAILVSSFMAPLIRYAGLGEKPAPGLIRVPFGPDQLRFLGASALSAILSALVVYAPIGVATYFLVTIISSVVGAPYAHFPDEASLHTIDIVSGAEAMTMRGAYWIYEYALWAAASAAIALVMAVVFFLHFRPRAEDKTAGAGVLARILVVVGGMLAYFAACYLFAKQLVIGAGGEFTNDVRAMVTFGAAALLPAIYFSLRLYPYAGVAVCQRSMTPGNTLRVTRRFNLLRLAASFLLLGLIFAGVWSVGVMFAGSMTLSALETIYQAADNVVRMFRIDGESAEWVLSFFRGLWGAIGFTATWAWTVFTYAVSAGLLGRLYRESVRAAAPIIAS